MSKHTPGPWYAGAQNDLLFVIAGRAPSKSNDDPCHDAVRTVIARVEGSDKGHAEESANANVLAAAPDLLATATACVDLFKPAREEWLNDAAYHDACDKWRALVAAIAKAEGR